MKVTILTLGSRGDVQPYVALGKGLQAAGHSVTFITGKGFDRLVTENGLSYVPLNADMLELAQSPEGKAAFKGKNMLTLMKKVMPVLRQVLDEAWAASQGTDAIVYHPKGLAGYHIAEKLGIPGFLSLPLPLYSPTREFPNPALPFGNLGGPLNKLTYSLFLQAVMGPYRKMINEWRRTALHLPPGKDELTLQGRPVPKLYSYSRHVVPIPADWDASTFVTGYWFLDSPTGWQPPESLLSFLDSGPAPVYVGFGSMPSEDAERITKIVLDALRQTGQRGVLASGWGGLSPADLPTSVYMLEAAPHDWLFPRMAAVVHHGGAGTTAAGLRAGRPTVVCPFFGDQPFWGRRVAALGAGPDPIPQKKLTVERLSQAIHTAVNDPKMLANAADLCRKIQAEDGVDTAVKIITGQS